VTKNIKKKSRTITGSNPNQLLLVPISDVKRGQNLEAEARALRPRSRPELWGQGWGRGQFLEVEAKAEAKDEVMNKKDQIMVDNIQVNLYHYDQKDKV